MEKKTKLDFTYCLNLSGWCIDCKHGMCHRNEKCNYKYVPETQAEAANIMYQKHIYQQNQEILQKLEELKNKPSLLKRILTRSK